MGSSNSQSNEPSKLLSQIAKKLSGSEKKDGLQWSRLKLEGTLRHQYKHDFKKLLKTLATENGAYGIIPGDDEIGFGTGLKAARHMRMFWAYGVGEHLQVHSSFAVVYR